MQSNVKEDMWKCSKTVSGNVSDTMSDVVGKVMRRACKLWITQEMIIKMEE
jgi:hypothetical protein